MAPFFFFFRTNPDSAPYFRFPHKHNPAEARVGEGPRGPHRRPLVGRGGRGRFGARPRPPRRIPYPGMVIVPGLPCA